MKREFEVVDMMLSIHSRLAERSRRYSRAVDITTLAGSVLLNATVLSRSPASDPIRTNLLIALSISIFFLSLLPLVVNWKGSSEGHDKACRKLARLKSRIRTAETSTTPEQLAEIRKYYDVVMVKLPKIPSGQFPRLKAHHYRKVALSRLVSAHPGAPVWGLRCRLFFADSIAIMSIVSRSDSLNRPK